MAPGVYVQTTPFTATDNIGGVEVVAEIGWVAGRPVIDTLTITRGEHVEISTAVLRGISTPELIARATNTGVRLYADADGTVPFDPARQDGESLEQWAARLGYAATALHISPADYIAEHQGIKSSTANQRLVVARKMGLLERRRERG